MIMSKKTLLKSLLVVGSLLAMCGPAAAAGRYWSLNSGVWLPHQTSSYDNAGQPVTTDYSAGWLFSGGRGVAFDSGLRLECDLGWRQADGKSAGSDGTWAFTSLVNAWWDVRNSSGVTPYFGGGFGYARSHVSSPGFVDETGDGFAYQVGTGVAVKLDRSLALDIGYRYFGISDSTSGSHGVGDDGIVGSVISTGLRFGF